MSLGRIGCDLGFPCLDNGTDPITVYWKPGGPYCIRLRSRLHRAGVVISLLIPVSLAVDTTCHPTLGAGADVIAVVVYVAFRSLRMRLARRESDDTVVVKGDHYFPLEDVNMEFLDESSTHTVCSWKGEASYYTVLVYESRPKVACLRVPTLGNPLPPPPPHQGRSST